VAKKAGKKAKKLGQQTSVSIRAGLERTRRLRRAAAARSRAPCHRPSLPSRPQVKKGATSQVRGHAGG
jgi:hypothetical protein